MAFSTIDLSKEPLQPPPPGVPSNFSNPPSEGAVIFVSTSLILVLSAVFVSLRCYTRLILLRKFNLTDYLFLFGYVLTLTNGALLMAAVQSGLGRKPWDIPMDMFFPHLALNLWVQRIAYALSLAVLKVAILMFYPQLNPSRRFHIIVWGLIGLVIFLTFCALLLDLFLCWPVNAAWDFQVATQHPCKSLTPYIVFTATLNIGTDMTILILPIVMLWNVQIARKKKVAVGLLLASGSFASLVSILRVTQQHDETYVRVAIWSNAEINAALICACLPTLKPFIRSSFPSLWPTSAKRSATPHSTPMVLSAQRRPPLRQEDKDMLSPLTPLEMQEQLQYNSSQEYILGDMQGVSHSDQIPAERKGGSENGPFREPV